MTAPHHKLPVMILTVFLGFVSTANACDVPDFDIEMPDGRTANADDMRLASYAVKGVLAEGDAYVECVRENEPHPARAKRLENSALDKMQEVAASYNRQIRLYRRANPE